MDELFGITQLLPKNDEESARQAPTAADEKEAREEAKAKVVHHGHHGIGELGEGREEEIGI